MSDNSRSDSNGSPKSFFGRKSGSKKAQVDASEMFKKSLRNITDRTKTMGANLQSNLQNVINSKKEASVYSKACRELDEFGYEKFNIDDDVEIFISKVPERALFNDGEPVLVRANDQNFVGTSVSTPKTAQIQADVPAEPARDIRQLFSNVQTGRSEEVITGYTGEVVNGEVHAHVDTAFLDKISNSHSEAKDTVAAEAPAEVPEAEEIVSVPAPVMDEEPISMLEFEEDSDIVIMEAPEEETIVAESVLPVLDADESAESEESEPEDDSWMYESDPEAEEILESLAGEESLEEPIVAAASIPTFREAPEEVETTPVEDEPEPVVEEVPADVAQASESAEEPESVPEASCTAAEEPEEVQVSAFVEEPVQEIATEEPVPEPAIDSAPIEGLYTEAAEAVSGVATIDTVATATEAAMAVTSSEAMPVSNPVEPQAAIKGMDENGSDILPPVNVEAVRRTPRAVRFRFHNGVLQNVEEKKEESEEGLRGPFDLTVGQTVSQETDIVRIPPVEITDEVADVMRLTVPELDVDEDSFAVGISYDEIPEDGLEELCFAPEPLPAIEIEDEVADIMSMTVPSLTEQATGFWEYEDIPEDGLEELCFASEPEPVYDASCIGIGVGYPAIAAAAPVHAIGAPSAVHALPAAEQTLGLPAASEAEPEPEAAFIPAAQPEAASHAVTFGFGNGVSTGSVCFSF